MNLLKNILPILSFLPLLVHAGPVEVLAPSREFNMNPNWSFLRIDGEKDSSLFRADSEADGNEAFHAFDGDPSSFWHSPWGSEATVFPHWIQKDLSRVFPVTHVRVLPRQEGTNGWIKDYEVFASLDGKSWGKPVSKGTFSQDKEWKTIPFDSPLFARYVRLRALSGFDGQPFSTVAELEILPREEKKEAPPSDFSAPSLDIHGWETVHLPHTPRIEPKEFKTHWQGLCWYRRSFLLAPEMKGKKVFIKFESVMQQATVWVNGREITTHDGGYLPFTIDIGELPGLHFDGETPNTLAVRADNRDQPDIPPGLPLKNIDLTYQGGIYRDVTLLVTDKLHITDAVHANETAGGGIFVKYPEVGGNRATLEVQVHVRNDRPQACPTAVRYTLFDAAGKRVATASNKAHAMASGTGHHFTQSMVVRNPSLWHPDHPYRYRLQVDLLTADGTVDSRAIRIGIRKIEWKNAGFFINGEKLTLHGANRHQDGMHIGNALPENAQRLDALKLREGGFNNVRAGHYPLDPAFMDACDEYGLTVIACIPGWHCFRETPRFLENSYNDVRNLIRRDRNHPSVILYETILNESGYSEAYARETYRIAKEEDPACFAACDHNYPAYELYDVNYKHPGNSKPFFSREWGDDNRFEGLHGTTWGDWARRSDESSMIVQSLARQKDLNGDGYWDWHGVNAKSTTAGYALWVGIDHNRGGSPNIARCGVLGLDRYPKFCYHFLKSQRSPDKKNTLFNSGPMVFIASHWTELTGSDLHVYSNAEKVRLYLDGQLLGERTPDTTYQEGDKAWPLKHVPHPIFTFPGIQWKAGTLRADALIGNKVVATHTVRTPGKAVRLQIELDHIHHQLTADGSDMALLFIKAIDKNGILVPNRDDTLHLDIQGQGRLIGTNPVQLEGGVAAIWLRSTTTLGSLTVTAHSEAIAEGTFSTQTVPPKALMAPAPSLPNPPTYRLVETGAAEVPGAPKLTSVPFHNVVASSTRSGSNVALLHDGDFETWWFAKTNHNQTIHIELDRPRTLAGNLIEWEKDSTWYTFSIDVSTDGEKWSPVCSGKKTGHDHDPEIWSAHAIRHIRINLPAVHPSDSLLGIREIELYE